MPLKSGTEEIIYLLKKVFEKYEKETNSRIKTKTTKTNYDEIADRLTRISSQLPYTAEKLQHQPYLPDIIPSKRMISEPDSKYTISSGQIMEAARGNVPNPKKFLVDSCYIYVYDVGRKGFALNPTDTNLLEAGLPQTHNQALGNEGQLSPDGDQLFPGTNQPLAGEGKALAGAGIVSPKEDPSINRQARIVPSAKFWPAILSILLLLALLGWYQASQKWKTLKKDLSMLPYKPSQAETDSLEGIWLCYTGSPQARRSEPRRYHLVVNNIVEVKARDGYFTFLRWGASFDHLGYMQFEAPWLVSIFSHVQNDGDSIQSPRHSLLQLNEKGPYYDVISASWNFDAGTNNKVIGIREVYIKQGKGGHTQEIFNTPANGSCKCKIVRWYKEDGTIQDYQIKNQLLDTLNIPAVKPLLDEKSILLCNPEPGLILMDSA